MGNGRYYGGGNIVDEHSTLQDGQLALFCLKPIRWWRLLLLGINFRRGNLQQAERVVCKTARKISVNTAQPKRIEADGEFKTNTPAEFEMIPDAISVIVDDMPVANNSEE